MLDIDNIAYRLPIAVDAEKILNEVETFILPGKEKLYNSCTSITNTTSTDHDSWFHCNPGAMTKMYDPHAKAEVTKHYSKYQLGFPGPWRDDLIASYDNGTTDKEMIYWHPALIGSEIYNLGQRIENFFSLPYKMRCRLSFLKGPTGLNKHADPHTPWRVHVNLKSGPNTRWVFYDVDAGQELEWHQPSNSVWLIRTGNIQHGVRIGNEEIRWQLFYHIWNKNLGPNYHQQW